MIGGVAVAAAILLSSSASWADTVKIKNPSFDGDKKFGAGGWSVKTPGWNQLNKTQGVLGVANLSHSQTGCGTPDRFLNTIPDGNMVALSNGGELS